MSYPATINDGNGGTRQAIVVEKAGNGQGEYVRLDDGTYAQNVNGQLYEYNGDLPDNLDIGEGATDLEALGTADLHGLGIQEGHTRGGSRETDQSGEYESKDLTEPVADVPEGEDIADREK